MAKVKKAFFCQNCGHESPKWLGKCPNCTEWNTFVEEVIQKEDKNNIGRSNSSKRANKAVLIQDITSQNAARIQTQDIELNRVLGGGIVAGSLILFGGEPGIGKSTLMLQIALQLENKRVLYVSGEESVQQIKIRAHRMEYQSDSCFLLNETSTQDIFLQIEETQPEVLVIDSIQTLYSPILDASPGSISQIKQCTAELMRFAKESDTPIFIIGHITKDGNLAGPKILEHMVDVVLQFEGDRNYSYRLLRTMKNRFGATHELGIYEMHNSGLRVVENPSKILINEREEEVSGVSIAATIEGIRPLLIEVQALVSTATYPTPQRSVTGFDSKRLNMLLAVLEKRCKFKLAAKDVFLNIAGGIKVDDPAIDLAVICSVLSSNIDIPLNRNICLASEVGLSGELRPVSKIDIRINEAQKLGYEKIIISQFTKGIDQKDYNIQIIKLKNVLEVFKLLFA